MRLPSASLLVAALSLALVACGGGDSGDGPTPPPNGVALVDTVFMPGDVFSPASLTIAVGGTVWFDFPARDHNVIFDRTRTGAPADIQPTRNRLVSRVFPTTGTFPYECRLHPGMIGEVVVR